ncbi:MAG: ABC transporter substrate-binding protein [Actinomycetota bacterium]|nr:ABC transporter substrate-binding protein [Actinomycetota bacterium]
MRRTRGVALVATTAAAALALSACGGSAGTKSSGGGTSSGGSASAGGGGGGAAGGTIYYLTKRTVEHWDPQRVYIGRDISNSQRLFTRTLVQQPATEDATAALKLEPDLATDTGTSSDGAKTWKFTLKDGLKWQDGKAITCADLKYGISRTFATDVITGGPNYILQFLDVPKDAKGGSAYKGPYTKVGQADYDKAVTCAGNTITLHFNKPWADFNYGATLPAFAPYRQDQDKGDKSNYAVFSDGPYKLQGTWEKGKGGTFVRNDQYDPKTDPTVRKALPDKFVFTEGLTDEVIIQRLIADSGEDKYVVTDRRVTPALEAQARSVAKNRLTNPVAPYVDYLVPNFKKMTNPKVREALAVATDKAAYITASGGSTHGTVAKSINAPSLLGYKDADVFSAGDSGDPAKAKQLLTDAGVPMPYPITYTYSGGTPTTEKEAAVIKSGWEKAGFKVTLNELTDTYYDVIQNPGNFAKYDVAWASWGADWPSGSTVIPPLFDDRINLSKQSNGQDYGLYASKAVDTAIDEALNKPDAKSQADAWAGIDQMLAKDVAYIPLIVNKFVFLRGSGVKGYINGAATSTFPDLATVAAK